MTPELAAERAAEVLEEARKSGIDERVAALVQVADGWTRLHTALATTQARDFLAVKTEPVAAVKEDADLAKIGDQFARQWAHAHGAWWPEPKPEPEPFTLSHDPGRPSIIRAHGVDYEVHGWKFDDLDDVHATLRLQMVRKS